MFTFELSSIKRVFRATKLLWSVAPAETTLVMLLLIIQGAVPAALIYVNKLIIDNLTNSNEIMITQLIIIWIIIQLFGVAVVPISQLFQGNLAEKFTAYINLKLMTKAEQILGLDILEEEEYYNDLKTLQKGAQSRPVNLIVNLMFSARDAITFIALSGLLASYAFWLPIALLLSAVPFARATLQLRELSWRALLANSKDARVMEYYNYLSLNYRFAHEIRVFNLFSWLRQRYSEYFNSTHRRMQSVRRKGVSKTVLPMLFSIVITGLIFSWVIKSAFSGIITVGVVVLVLQAMNQMRSTIANFIESVGYLFDRSLYFKHYFRFLEIESSVIEPQNPLPLPDEPEIIFDNVSFNYNDGQSALKDISFSIPYGQSVAIVGENGAGKTTLVKLLLRFYNPTQGRIIVGKSDIKTYSVTEWRAAIGVIFQDFGRYAFSVAENIGIGHLSLIEDKVEIERAGSRAGLDMFISQNSEISYDTKLGKEFGGTELSGGQWQKIAIARALLRQPKILILDEPSAALDARAESQLFADFSSLSRDRTTIFITHHLSSVQMADCILVLKDGELVEIGRHNDLLAKRGEYFELWSLQAEKFKDTVTAKTDTGMSMQ